MRNLFARVLAILATCLLTGCATLASGAVTNLSAPLRQGVLSGKLGEGLPQDALAMASDAEYRALERGQTGMPIAWKSSERIFGSVVPQQPYSVGPTNCRRYLHTISVSGETRAATGTACRQETGAWRPLD